MDMANTRDFKVKQEGFSGSNGGMVLGVLMMVMGVVSLGVSGSGGSIIGAGFVFMVIGIWNSNRSIIVLHADHLEMKVAPLAPRRLVLYHEIDEIDESKGPKKVFLVVGSKRIALPIAVLAVSEQEELLKELRKHVGKGGK